MLHALVDHKRRVCFFWSPKCASRSLFTWINVCLMGGKQSDRGLSRRVSNVFRYRYKTAVELVQSHDYLAIAFVRHPARRIVSAYLNKFVMTDDGDDGYYDGLEPFARWVIDELQSREGAKEIDRRQTGITFRELLDYCAEKMADPVEGRKLNAHWGGQMHANMAKHRLRFDHVCAVETLHEDFEPVRQFYDAKMGLVSRNVSVGQQDRQDAESEDLSEVRAVALRGRDISQNNFLTSGNLTAVQDVFAADYRFLGYDPFDTALPPTIREANKTEISQPTFEEMLASSRKGFLASWLGGLLGGGPASK